MKSVFKISAFVLLITAFLLSCKKSEFLDALPDQGKIIPSTLKDCEAILDNSNFLNGYGIGLVPGLSEIGSDNYYIPADIWITDLTAPYYRDEYLWGDDIYLDVRDFPQDWGFGYRCVYHANTVLEVLAKIIAAPDEKVTYDRLRSSALFYRAHAFWWLLQAYALPYDVANSNTDPGIPLKMTPDISEKLSRASVEECYQKIIADLNECLSGLPDAPVINMRPSKLAVYGLLARIYLSMRNYDKALQNSDTYLNLKSTLLDYNTMSSSTSFYPMPDPRTNNPEIAFYSEVVDPRSELVVQNYYSRVDSNLYSSYAVDDLRRKVFFESAETFFGIPGDNGYFFRGSYLGRGQLFAGIATDELYLTRAECYARKSDVVNAMKDLNDLMRKRCRNSVPYLDITASNGTEALAKVLLERRKELVYRGLRWVDLRRLNKEGANITVSRVLDGQTYTLPPNSLRYAWVLPQNVLDFNPSMQQNPR